MPRKRKKPKKPLKQVIVSDGKHNAEIGYFKIEICAHRQFMEFLFADFRYAVAYRHYLKFIEESKKVILPVRYTKTKGEDYKPARYEIIMIKKTDKDETTMLPNEFGDNVEITAFNARRNGKKWKMLHRDPYFVEERFQLFDCEEKKDVTELYHILFEEHLPTPLSHCHINIYKNKLIFVYNPEDVEVVITKNRSEAVRLYNKLKEFVHENRNKHKIAFLGYCPGPLKRKIIDIIQERTGWNRVRICRAQL